MSNIPQHLPCGSLLQGGKYRIVRFIAAGGFGCTYEAEHVLLEKRVAIKEFFMQDYCNREDYTNRVTVGTKTMHELVDKYKRKFIGEAKALSGLEHEGIVSVSDVFEENGTAYFVMDYVDGQSLAGLCKNGPLPEKHALYYIRQVCEALAYVHDHNRLHLDIKPGNIMVKADGCTVLIDFGASKQYDAASGENNTTVPGYTPGYAPLEQTQGDIRQFLPATDIYALGATLYCLLTGRPPLKPADRLNEGEGLDFPLSISAATRHAVEHALEIRKKDRPQSVREFVDLLNVAVQPVQLVHELRPEQVSVKENFPAGISVAMRHAVEQAMEYRKKDNLQSVREFETLQDASVKSEQPGFVPKPAPVKAKVVERPRVGTVQIEEIEEDGNKPARRRKKLWPWIVVGLLALAAVVAGIFVIANLSEEKGLKKDTLENLTVSGSANGYDYVDLGLSVKWATCNVGASCPEEYGNYYAWGETNTKSEYTKYNSKTWERSMGDISGDPEYDAARANWGGSWRMPTKAEFDELGMNCDYELTTQNGVVGLLFTSKKNGNSIFFPAAGGPTDVTGEYGAYLSSTPDESNTRRVYFLYFDAGDYRRTHMDRDYRYYGGAVRPVLE